jgi:hypothetical protein
LAENLSERQLVAAVRFARQGDKARARSLLEEILKQERTNEQAWIWMASVVDSPKERRVCIERVIKINPKNAPAQAALNTMVGVLAGAEQPKIDYEAISKAAVKPLPVTGTRKEAAPPPRNLATQAGSGPSFTRILLIGVAGLLALLFILTLVAPSFFTESVATSTPTEAAAEVTVDPNISATPEPSATIAPSATFNGTIPAVTREFQLPPTYTPTITATSTDTPTATATLPPVTNYNWFLLASQGTSNPALYTINGSGAGLDPFLANLDEFDYDINTGLLAITEVSQSTSETGFITSSSRLYYVSIGALENRTEITNSNIPNAISPAISPDGTRIAFASDADGDFEIYIYDIAAGTSRKLTNNSQVSDIDPDWSSAGSNIVYASDVGNPGSHQIYNVSANSENAETEALAISDLSGSNTNPAWSPSSGQVVFTNVSSAGTRIVLTDANGSFVRDLSFVPSHFYSEPAWTGDGLYIVFASGADERRQSLSLVPAQGGQAVVFPIDDLNIRRVLPR